MLIVCVGMMFRTFIGIREAFGRPARLSGFVFLAPCLGAEAARGYLGLWLTSLIIRSCDKETDGLLQFPSYPFERMLRS